MATTKLRLGLKIGRNPEVLVNFRDKKAAKSAIIRWKRFDTTEFTIVDFQPSGPGSAFSTPQFDPDGQWVECTYQPADSTPSKAFEYTITVKDEDGNTHDTTEVDDSGGPTERRPVIRN